jgi:hypothetical protein
MVARMGQPVVGAWPCASPPTTSPVIVSHSPATTHQNQLLPPQSFVRINLIASRIIEAEKFFDFLIRHIFCQHSSEGVVVKFCVTSVALTRYRNDVPAKKTTSADARVEGQAKQNYKNFFHFLFFIGLTQSEYRKEISAFKNFLKGKRTQMYVRFKKFLNVEISKRDEVLRKSYLVPT